MFDKATLHELAIGVIVGDAGKMTAFTVLLTPQNPDPCVVVVVDPQAALSTYRARTV